MAREIGMTFTLGGTLGSDFKSAFKTATGQIQGISQAIRDMERTPVGKIGASMAKQKGKIHELRSALRTAEGQLSSLRVQSVQAGTASAVYGRRIAMVSQHVESLTRQLARATAKQRENVAQAVATSGSVLGLSRAYRELAADATKARQNQQSLNVALKAGKGAASGMAAIHGREKELRAQRSDMQSRLMTTAASAMTVAAPIKLSVDFEDAMARAGALAKVDQSGLAEMTAQARQLGRDTVFSATQVSEGMQYLAMAGFNKGQIKGAMPGMLDLAAAGKTDLAATADIASNILTPFEIPAERMGHVADVLTATFTSANTDLLKLGDTMKYVAPVAHELGMSLEETSAVSALMANAGIQGTMAGTAARAGLARLAAPPKMAAEALYQLGVSTKDVAGNMLPVTEILDQLFEKTARLGNAERAGAFKKIFGEDAFSAWLAVMRQGQKEVAGADGKTTTALRNIVASYENADGAAARMSEQMNATTGGALRRLKSAWEDVGITVGNFFMPVISGAAGFLTNAANAISGFAERFPVLSKGIALAAGALVAFSATGLVAGLVINGMRMGLVSLQKGFIIAGAQSKIFGLTLKSALIGTGVGAILVGLGMAAEFVISHWEEIGPALSRVFGPIRETVGGAIDWVRDRFAGFVTFFTRVGPAIASRIGPSIERISNAFANIWNGIRAYAGFIIGVWRKAFGFVADIFSGIGSFAVSVWEGIAAAADAAVELVQSIWSGITGFFGDLWDGVCNLASGAWIWITSAGSTCLEGLTMSWGWLTDFFGTLWEGICTTVSSAWDWIATSCEPVATFVTGIWEGVSSFLSGVWDGVVAAAQACWEGISVVWAPVTDFFSGIVDGIRSVFAGLFEWLADMFKWVTDVIGSIKSAVGSIFGAASDIVEGAKGIGTAIGEGVSEAYNDAALVTGMRGKAREDERRRQDDAQFLAKMAEHRRRVEEKERLEGERKRLAREGQKKPRAEWAPPTDPKAGKGGRSRSGSGGGGSRRGSGASSRSTGTGTTIVRLAGDNRNFTTQYIPAGAARTSGAPLPVSGVSSASASGGRQSVSGTGRSTASGASASPTRTTMPTVSNATAIVAAKPLPVIVQNFPGQKKGVTLEPEKSAPLPVALPQQPIQLSTPASAIPTGTPSPLASTTPSASVPAPATGLRARTAPVMGGLLEGLRGRMSGMLSTTGAALRDLPEAATRLVGDLSSDVTSVLPFMGKHGPYLPGNINLPDRGRSESGAPVDGGNGTVQVSLHQTFNVGGGNADAIQRRLTALGPEFERMVRRALSDISAQDRRVAYAQ